VTKRWVCLLGLCLMLAGCGQGQFADQSAPAPAPSISAPPPASAPRASATVAATSSSARSAAPSVSQPVSLYFTEGGKLAAVPSEVSGPAPAKATLEQLLKGPKDSRHSTEIPASAQLEDVSISGGTATVSFNDAFFTPNGATGTLLRLAQVVYTVTQFSGVTAVRFLKDGQSVGVIGEGFPLNRSLTRGDFSRLQA